MKTNMYRPMGWVVMAVLGISQAAGLVGSPVAGAAQPRWLQRGLAWPDLTPRLVQPKTAKTPPPNPQQLGQMLKDMLQGMGQSANHLYSYDAGKNTQTIQKKIISDLDQLIAIAKKNPPPGGGGKSKKKNKGQKMSQNSRSPSSGSSSPTNSPSAPALHSYNPGGGPMNPQTGKPFLSSKKQWGNLPARERNLILNGIRKSTLPGYQSLVNAYYESLGKLGSREESK